MKRLRQYQLAKLWLRLMKVAFFALVFVIAAMLVIGAYHGDKGAQAVLLGLGGLVLFVVTFIAADLVDYYE